MAVQVVWALLSDEGLRICREKQVRISTHSPAEDRAVGKEVDLAWVKKQVRVRPQQATQSARPRLLGADDQKVWSLNLQSLQQREHDEETAEDDDPSKREEEQTRGPADRRPRRLPCLSRVARRRQRATGRGELRRQRSRCQASVSYLWGVSPRMEAGFCRCGRSGSAPRYRLRTRAPASAGCYRARRGVRETASDGSTGARPPRVRGGGVIGALACAPARCATHRLGQLEREHGRADLAACAAAAHSIVAPW